MTFPDSCRVTETVARSWDALSCTSAVVVLEVRDARRLAEVVQLDRFAVFGSQTESVLHCRNALSDTHVVHLVIVALGCTDAVRVLLGWDALLSVGLVTVVVCWGWDALRSSSAVVVCDRRNADLSTISVRWSWDAIRSADAVVVFRVW